MGDAVAMVGMRSRASGVARPRKGAKVRNVEGSKKEPQPESAKSADHSGKTKHGDVRRRTRGSASLPAPAERFGPIISPAHTNDLALTRNGRLLLSVLFRTVLGQI